MPRIPDDDSPRFSRELEPEEELDFDIDTDFDVAANDDDADDTALERELGRSWRSARPSRDDE